MHEANIIVGHSNMDLDCIGSIVLSKYLFPGYIPVRSSRINPAARNLYNIYETHLDFSEPSDLKELDIGTMVVVDTRSAEHIAEYLAQIGNKGLAIEVFDHHPAGERDICGAVIRECVYGANTTQMALELMNRNLSLSSEDATIALTAVYADTGNFLHSNVCPEDFTAASFLLEQGAELSLVKEFLVPLREKKQITLFHEVLNKIETRVIRGHTVHLCYLEMEEDTQGLGAVVEKVFEVENSEIFFGFFFFTGNGRLLIIARNSCEDIHVNEILSDFGGGGHRMAAAATIKTFEGHALYVRIMEYLVEVFSPAATAADIMTREVATLSPGMSLLEASLFLEQVSHTGAPVVDENGVITGFLTLREIMKGRKQGKMLVPVKAFMTHNPVCVAPETNLREVEEILYQHNIGHLPVIEDGRLAGIVTRRDFLEYMSREEGKKKQTLATIGAESACTG